MTSPTTPTSAMPPANAPLQPTWHGFVADTREALTLFEAVIQGQLNRVVRRPHDRERSNLIRSGSVFIYEENNSGIKRWTDGVPWSPSRILGNFLIYRELDKPFPPGEKKRARKPGQRKESLNDDTLGIKTEDGADGILHSPTTPQTPVTPGGASNDEREQERSLVGSLTDSYSFKEGGLVKKTMSVVVHSVHYHLVSYYNPDEVRRSMLERPSGSQLRFIQPRPELIRGQNFRAPLEEGDEALASPYSATHHQQQQQRNPYAMQQAYMSAPQHYLQSPHGYTSMPPPPGPYYHQQMQAPDPYGDMRPSMPMQPMQSPQGYHYPSMPHHSQAQAPMQNYAHAPQSPFDPRFPPQNPRQPSSPYSPQTPNHMQGWSSQPGQ